MIRKITFIFFIFLLFNQCGYQPLYSSKNIKFNINEIKTSGELKIGKIIEKKIQNFGQKNPDSVNLNLNIFSEVIKNTTSKDKKGNPKTFSLVINVKLKVINNYKEIREKDFSQSTSYSNNSNKFDLKKYENSLKNNLTEKITENIFLYLQNLNI